MSSGKSEKEQIAGGIWPWVAIAAVIIAAAVIRGRLLSVPLERDEGEYAYIAQQMLKGIPPYISAYSMKLPGIDAVYALIIILFGQTPTGIHLGLLIFNAATIFVVFLLTKRMFGSIAAVSAGSAYAVLSTTSGVTGLWANAEHFVILPALIGMLLIYRTNDKTGYFQLFAAGLFFGLAFIIKQHGIMFAIFGALYLLYTSLRNKPIRWARVILAQIAFAAGVMILFALVCFYFFHYGVFGKFWFWTNTYAREYATAVPLADAWIIFKRQADVIIIQNLPISVFTILGFFAVCIIRRYRQWAALAAGFFAFSFLAVCPGFYFREHYFIFLLPVAAILTGVSIAGIDGLYAGTRHAVLRIVTTGAIGLAVVGYTLYDQREFLFVKSPERVCREVYGGNPFPESLSIAEYIRHNTSADDTILVAGSEPEIYFYSDRRSATPYIYMYPLMELNPSARIMQQEMISQIEAAKPRIIVFVRIDTSWLPQSNSDLHILQWFETYSHEHYELTGLIELVSADSTIYYWNSEAKDRTPKTNYWLAVFKRRQ